MVRKVGIFAGTFDPVHEGHVSFAREAIDKSSLDKVFFLVEPRPRRKQGVRAFKHRINMVQLAIEDEPKLGLIILEQPRFSVTETMPILNRRFTDMRINLLMGEDVLAKLTEWPQVDHLMDNVHFIIGTRRDNQDLESHIASIEKTRGRALNHSIFGTELSDITSSGVRSALRRGQVPKGIHPEVMAYIVINGLYVPSSK